MSVIQAYIQAFGRCYPHHSLKVKPKKMRGELKFAVVINEDRGDLLLSEEDLRSSTRDFNRGKTLT